MVETNTVGSFGASLSLWTWACRTPGGWAGGWVCIHLQNALLHHVRVAEVSCNPLAALQALLGIHTHRDHASFTLAQVLYMLEQQSLQEKGKPGSFQAVHQTHYYQGMPKQLSSNLSLASAGSTTHHKPRLFLSEGPEGYTLHSTYYGGTLHEASELEQPSVSGAPEATPSPEPTLQPAVENHREGKAGQAELRPKQAFRQPRWLGVGP